MFELKLKLNKKDNWLADIFRLYNNIFCLQAFSV